MHIKSKTSPRLSDLNPGGAWLLRLSLAPRPAKGTCSPYAWECDPSLMELWKTPSCHHIGHLKRMFSLFYHRIVEEDDSSKIDLWNYIIVLKFVNTVGHTPILLLVQIFLRLLQPGRSKQDPVQRARK
jgi:hypothetical protein